ncbi:hypothetical protein D3C85_1585640 [compost metagenome]
MRNPYACVLHAYDYRFIGIQKGHMDTALLGVTNSISQQIQDNLFHPLRISMNQRGLAGGLEGKT